MMENTLYGLLALAAAALLAIEFSLDKIYRRKAGNSLVAGLFFNALNGFFTAIVFFFANSCKLSATPFSVLSALGMAILVILYTLVGFKILKNGAVAEYSMFLMTGGMTVPFVFGVVFLNEALTLPRAVGILIIIASIIVSKASSERISASSVIMCGAVFVLNGFVSVISKLHQSTSDFATVSSLEFVMLSGIAKFVVSSIAIASVIAVAGAKASTQKKAKASASAATEAHTASEESSAQGNCRFSKTIPIILLCAAIGGVSYAFQLVGAKNLPASVLYPIVTGGSIIMSAITDFIFFGQKPDKKTALCIAACFVGTCMFL